ncbi:uncharacterized protein TRIADDRAFT_56252 [Trichoplax adhaerens]|uniref:Clathrin/coatomer adaptor adaptin-like N-terminal domain-containing protein n=1 Tax=Trichoplax adhaerens TaxID=10228 RepID=B3RXL5_TRIAD|nr:predicted protein [Trichoplax adhaerens]EDV24448.1 predicted protein [Trichoplax adhaerens]|eukprot:XP_002112338.1 predicted protein [Trichoplax adhaerens]
MEPSPAIIRYLCYKFQAIRALNNLSSICSEARKGLDNSMQEFLEDSKNFKNPRIKRETARLIVTIAETEHILKYPGAVLRTIRNLLAASDKETKIDAIRAISLMIQGSHQQAELTVEVIADSPLTNLIW